MKNCTLLPFSSQFKNILKRNSKIHILIISLIITITSIHFISREWKKEKILNLLYFFYVSVLPEFVLETRINAEGRNRCRVTLNRTDNISRLKESNETEANR